METKKISWLSKLLFGKWCLMPGYSKHLDFYAETARRSQIQEDKFVESEIERLAQEQYHDRITKNAEWDAFLKTLNHPESTAYLLSGYCIYTRTYWRCYHVYDEATAKFANGRLNINQLIQDRYNELLSGHGHNCT
jgi:hypothetical protein